MLSRLCRTNFTRTPPTPYLAMFCTQVLLRRYRFRSRSYFSCQVRSCCTNKCVGQTVFTAYVGGSTRHPCLAHEVHSMCPWCVLLHVSDAMFHHRYGRFEVGAEGCGRGATADLRPLGPLEQGETRGTTRRRGNAVLFVVLRGTGQL